MPDARLSGAAVSPWRGELEDPGLESDYLDAALDDGQRRLRLSWILVVATALAYVAKDAYSLEPQGALISLGVRVLGVLPGVPLLILGRARSGRELQRRAFWTCLAFIPSFVAVNWLYAQVSLMAPLWFALLMLMNGLWMAHSFRDLVGLNVLLLGSAVLVMSTLGGAGLEQRVSASILLVAAFAWSLIGPAMLGAARRREYGALLSAFPPSVVRRLLAGEPVAEQHAHVTVLFADLVGFTRLAEQLRPEELLPILEALFSRFDRIAAAHGVEPIKTIGDSYMAAAGVPEPRPDHVEAAARMALDMRRAVAEERFGEHVLQVRIGVHTGPLLAGVVRTRRQLYDLWGDTVNVASRLESHGEPGRIQVSEAVAEVLRPLGYVLEPRGRVSLKGHEGVEAAFLEAGPEAAG
ncbi:MAG: adenylate/guanylate cyclase domain-containing protein [Alphaproteobacteria bacterium]|nr:adenylate/guanylate cyclase domain-containing protein [Alphaproteobacteria bacterium]MCB9793604.1 adenylate/guanylate cyclase domain-containing protein [Alphaproteobacteria bacterium]